MDLSCLRPDEVETRGSTQVDGKPLPQCVRVDIFCLFEIFCNNFNKIKKFVL